MREILYHGTDLKFDAFDLSKCKKCLFGNGVYLSSSKAVAECYGDNILTCVVDTNKIIKNDTLTFDMQKDIIKEVKKYLTNNIELKYYLDEESIFFIRNLQNYLTDRGKEKLCNVLCNMGYDGMRTKAHETYNNYVIYNLNTIKII